MLIKPTLFLRNEEGGSPGGGSAPPPPAMPPASNGAPAAPAITADLLREALAPVIAEVKSSVRDGVFAELRKAGALKPDKPNDPPPTPAAPSASAPAPSLTQSDVVRIAETRVAIATLRDQHGLSDAQVSYLSAHLEHSKPENVYAAAKSFLSDLGLAKAPQPVTPPQPATPNQPALGPTPAPIATPQLGAPSPGDSRDPEAILHSRPFEATAHDFERLVAAKGKDEALKIWNRAVLGFAKTVKVTPDYRRQR